MKRLASLASSTVRVHLSCTSPAIGCESEVSLLAQFSFDMTHQFHSRSIATVASTPTSAMYPVALSHIASPSPISPACSFPTPFFPKIRGLLVDAAGTLLVPSEPAAAVYRRYAAHYAGGASPLLSEQEVLHRFRKAYNSKWCGSSIRYVGDGRPFWHHIVSESTGCSSTEMFEQIYEYYERPEAWKITPGAVQALHKLRSRGIKLAVVSNFDTRLRPLLQALQLSSLFDQIIVSAEVGEVFDSSWQG